LAPVAVVKIIVPRRMNALKKRRNRRSIGITAKAIPQAVPGRRNDACRTKRFPAPPIKIVSVAERRYCAGDKADIPKYRSCGEFENGEPSAQSCHVDVSDRLLCGGARRGSESRGWQEPFPDIRGHLQRLSQKPARPFEDGPGGIAVRFP